MALILTAKHSRSDLRAWSRWVDLCTLHSQTQEHLSRVERARMALADAYATHRDDMYVSVSWGKDSVALAHLSSEVCPDVTLCHVSITPWEMDDTRIVRDRFLQRYPLDYREFRAWCGLGVMPSGREEWSPLDLVGGFRVSGIRGDESTDRGRRMRFSGESTSRTCAPLIRWKLIDSFAYCIVRDLPLHSCYGYLMDGTLDIRMVRVDSMMDPTVIEERGRGNGREEWQRRYYGKETEDAIRLASEKRVWEWFPSLDPAWEKKA